MARRRKPRSGKAGVCWHTDRLIEADIGRSPTTEKRRLRGAWHGEETGVRNKSGEKERGQYKQKGRIKWNDYYLHPNQ
ncbi:MAG: hypothetical protein SOV67_14485 [Bariatricus massiliensis]|nr:hypothetical protein [Bariatricus massiliensis]